MNSKVFSIILGFLLIATAFLPATAQFWAKIDLTFFMTVNPLLANDTFGTFVALLNSRLGDWISHLAFAALLVSSIPQRKEAIYSLIGMVIIAILTQFLVNYCVFKKFLDFLKDSPSLSVPYFIDIEKLFPFPNNHATTVRSFPGDHSTTLFVCTTWILIATGRRLLKPLLFLAILFSLPRLLAGAHGLSDVIAGAGAITLIVYPVLTAAHQLIQSLAKPKQIA